MEQLLQPIVEAIKSGKKVTFFQGAGISTNAGIPDFRSPKTGLYANLAKLNLPYAEAVFDIDYFRENPKAFYTLASELFPGKFMPTKYHYMLKLFQEKKLLKRVYTQNIDTLERLAGVDDEFIVEAHGSFANCHCIECHSEMSTEELKKYINEKKDSIPTCAKCEGYIKPDIVFFGEALPERLFDKWDEDEDEIDVAIVAGTSLTVHPFAGLPEQLHRKTHRLLINKEPVGSFKHSKSTKDIVLLEDCDKVLQILCELLGWGKELESLIEKERFKYQKPELTAEDESRKIANEIVKEERERKEEGKETKDKKDKNKEEDKDKAEADDTQDLEAHLDKLQI
jgi:NAD-dependent histone deacetylase SIR2